MNYYEELGVPSTAPLEEIRRVYRDLVRLLHPDPQQDPALRRVAECELRRLNEVFATLSDPRRRRAYDRGLAGLSRRSAQWRPAQAWVWMVTAGIGLGSALWYFSHRGASRAPDLAPAPTVQAAGPASASRPARRAVRAARRRLSRNVRATLAPRPEDQAPPETPGVPPELREMPGPPPRLAVEIPELPPPSSFPRGFAGSWFYASARPATRVAPLYPPEYIEVVISEADGFLRGRFRGRYVVADKAISPEISFHFEGPTAAGTARVRWIGGAGLQGEASLRLLSDKSIEVNWWASELGSHAGLSSGTAVLTRGAGP